MRPHVSKSWEWEYAGNVGVPKWNQRSGWYTSRVLASGTRNDRGLVFLRIAIGVFFLIFAEYKVTGRTFVFGGGFQFWINRFLEDGAYPFMVPVLRNFVLPHATAIALMVAVGELAIGLALVLGVWVRTASVGGVVYMLTLLFSSNYPGAHVALWQYFGASLDHSVFAVCFVTLILGNSEACWSWSSWRISHLAKSN